MSHIGKNEPDLQSVLRYGEVAGSGQAIRFAENVMMSGVDLSSEAAGRAGVAVVNPSTGLDGALIRTGDDVLTYSFRDYPTTGMGLEFGATQLSLFHGGSRRMFLNSGGANFQFGSLSEYRKAVFNVGTSVNPVASQGTGTLSTNIGATGVLYWTLPQFPAAGNYYTFVRIDDFPLRIVPGAGGGFIMATGQIPDGNYIELGNVGASVQLVSNSNWDWMVINQQGTVTPQ